MLLTTEPPGRMERPGRGAAAGAASASPPRYPPRAAGKAAGRGERERSPSSKGRRPKKAPKTAEKKERVKKRERAEEEEEVKVEEAREGRSTVVDVDSVREKEDREDDGEAMELLESEGQQEGVKSRSLGVCEWVLMVLSLTMVLLFLPLSIWFCVKVVREHERAVIFRLGHLLRGRPGGPGLIFYLPFLDVCQKVDIRLKMLNVPPHTVVTKDLVSTEVSAVCYYRIENVALCSTTLSNVTTALQKLVQGSDRHVLAHHTFTHILLHRRTIGQEIQVAIDSVACQWGIRVERAEIEDLCLPLELKQSLSAEAEARRQAHIKVIAAEGERAACEALRVSLDSLSGSPAAVQLRLLQLLHLLRTERPAVVLTMPSDLLTLPPDLSPLPPPPPPVGDGAKEEERGSDSPMM